MRRRYLELQAKGSAVMWLPRRGPPRGCGRASASGSGSASLSGSASASASASEKA